MTRRIIILTVAIALFALPALASETDGDCVYRLYDESGAYLTARAGRMYEGDEYIAGDDNHYRVSRVDDDAGIAYAEHIGVSELSAPAFSALAADEERTICMYSTHSDESYVPNDGDSSLIKNAGIFDVGGAFAEALEERGAKVEYSDDTFYPHDAGAYSRSRSTAEELLKESPDALFDIHRDGVPAEEYETEIGGERSSMVRLFVGRSNQNAGENMAFAKKIKAAADEMYPGLVKDIYMGRGNYNQELYPRALLLEFGTHEIDKELAIKATGYMADVVTDVLYEGARAADGAGEREEDGGAVKGVIWVIGIAVLAALIYALASTGKLSKIWSRFGRSVSELTGGSIGKKPKDK